MTTCLTFALLTLAAGESLEPGDHRRELMVDGRTRNYLVHVPKIDSPPANWPVVLVYHGGGSNSEVMIRFCGMNEKADEAGFISVYPSGTGRLPRVLTYNGGNCCGRAIVDKVDDIAFTRAVLDDLEKVVVVDKKRVFATGMSNGAIMSYRVASELADRIAAIAPVAGPMGTEACSPSQPVPVCHFHGIDDAFAPYKGGNGTRSRTRTEFYSVDHSIQAWVKANGCDTTPKTEELPKQVEDGTSVTRTTYSRGKGGSEVVLYTIRGMGHTWPGRDSRARFLGATTKNVSANDVMWEFFKRHARK
jgi:polyhydroxybutyrate depolymerase